MPLTYQEEQQQEANRATAQGLGASSSGSNQAGNYYTVQNNGTVWMRPQGGSTNGWMYGATSPTAGVDVQAWNHIANPLAFEYGGARGGAGLEQQRYANMAKEAMNRAGPQMNLSEYTRMLDAEGRSRDAQMRSLDMAEALATGRGYSGVTSAANAQLQQGLAQNMQQQLSLAAQARGGGAGLAAAQQNAQQQNMLANTATNFQAANMRAQEQQQWAQSFAQQAMQMRAADLQRAGMSAQMAFQQAQLEAGQRGLNNQAMLGFEGMRQGVFNAQLAAQQAGEAQNAGTGLSQAQQAWAREQADNAFYRQLIGGAMTAAGGALGGPAGAAGGSMAGQQVNEAAFGSSAPPTGNTGMSGRYMT